MNRITDHRAWSAMRCSIGCILCAHLALGCGGSGEETTDPDERGCAAPRRLVGERCLEPGVGDDGCAAGSVALNGACELAGIAPGMCGEGFVHDGDRGCEPVLPADPCAPGSMAVPGEDSCRPVMPCGSGTWGDIDTSAVAVFVDASFTGIPNGSMAAPYPTITEALEAATAGALVAVAEGTYAEDLVVGDVRLHGVCPERARISGTQSGTVVISDASSGELRGLGISGSGAGVVVVRSEDVTLEELWVHDTGGPGIAVLGEETSASARIVGVLVEGASEAGVAAVAADVSVEASVVRHTQSSASGLFGRGIDVAPRVAPYLASQLTLARSLVEQSREAGISVIGSHATVDASVVRATLGLPDGRFGRGVSVRDDIETQNLSSFAMSTSVVEANRELGVFLLASQATVETTVVRDTSPQEVDGASGHGISVQMDPATGGRSTIAVRHALVEQSHSDGIFVFGSEAELVAVAVRDTLPRASDGLLGHGIYAQAELETKVPSLLTVRGGLVERSQVSGIAVAGATASIQTTLVRVVSPAQGLYGDGIVVVSALGAADASLHGSRIETTARAGVVSFGAAASLGATAIECATIPLVHETYEGQSANLEDLGGNACGCPRADGSCRAVSSGLEPPSSELP